MKKGLLLLVVIGACASFAGCAKKDKKAVKKEHKHDSKEMAGYQANARMAS